MGERSALAFSASAALAFAAIAGLWLAGCALDPGPAWLQAGTVLEPELAIDEKLELRAHLESGWALHLAVDQRGLDVALKVATAEEAAASSELPFGPLIREEARFLATEPIDLSISLEAQAGRGRPRLEVLQLGPATALDAAAARDFALFERSRGSSTEPDAAALRRLGDASTDPRLRILASGHLGLFQLGQDSVAALATFDRALDLLRKSPDSAMKAHLLAHRFRALLALGQESPKAVAEVREAAIAAGDSTAVAVLENYLGHRAWNVGDHPAAIHHFAASRDSFQKAAYFQRARGQELRRARAHMRTGSSPEPLARMLRLWSQLPDGEIAPPSGAPPLDIRRAELLREIGWWFYLEGNLSDAGTLITRAHQLAPEGIETLLRLAACQLQLNDLEGAAQSMDRAQVLPATSDQRAAIDVTTCYVDLEQGRFADARSRCTGALENLRQRNQHSAAAAVESILARLEKRDGKLEFAEKRAAAACAAVESQRGMVGDDRDRMDFLAERVEAFELLAGIRLTLHTRQPQEGWEQLALETVEQVRARRLRDLLEGGNAGRLLGNTQDRRREEELLSILARTNRSLAESLLLQQSFDPKLCEQADAALGELDRMDGTKPSLPAPETGLRVSSPLPTPVGLHGIYRELEPGTAMLVFHLGQEEAFGWVLTRNGLRGAALGDPGRIRYLAEVIHGQTIGASPFADRSLTHWAAQLSELLYTPFSTELEAARQVVVVAPAELQQLSFAALPFPAASGRPLIASRALANLPSAALLPALRRAERPRRETKGLLAIVDDPVYDNDSRLPARARRPGRFRRLADTADEAADLQNLVGAERSTRLSGFAANRERLLGGALQGFRFLHFATHGRTTDPPHGLVLSRFDESGAKIDDGFAFPELAGLKLDAELAVISACSSALGENVEGEGLLGLSQGFLSAGIPRLLLTLWPVKGDPARRVVGLFYRNLLNGIPPAEALRRAQAGLAREGRPRKDWAAFALYGDWRPLSDMPKS